MISYYWLVKTECDQGQYNPIPGRTVVCGPYETKSKALNANIRHTQMFLLETKDIACASKVIRRMLIDR